MHGKMFSFSYLFLNEKPVYISSSGVAYFILYYS